MYHFHGSTHHYSNKTNFYITTKIMAKMRKTMLNQRAVLTKVSEVEYACLANLCISTISFLMGSSGKQFFSVMASNYPERVLSPP